MLYVKAQNDENFMDFERKATNIIARGLLKTKKEKRKMNDDNGMKEEELKSDKYIVSPYLRQRVENL